MIYNQQEIIPAIFESAEEVGLIIQKQGQGIHVRPEPEKWSSAEHVHHLVLSTKPVILALNLPRFGLRLFGKPKTQSKSYEQICIDYKAKLEAGAEAPKPYHPDQSRKLTPDQVIGKWSSTVDKLVEVTGSWKDDYLDQYILPHPLLGKLTVREMLFFTIYHTKHHARIMERSSHDHNW